MAEFDPTNPLAQIQSMMKGELDPAREAQSLALQRLRDVHTGVTPVEASDEGPKWGAIASGLSSLAPTGTSMDLSNAIAGAGGAYGKELQRQFTEQRAGQAKGADLEFQDASKRLTALESKYMGALSNRGTMRGALPQKVSLGNGKWGWMDPMNPNAGIQPMAENDAQDYDHYYDLGFKSAMSRGLEDPGSYAQQFAAERVKSRPSPTLMQNGIPNKPFPLGGVEVDPGVDRSGTFKALEADEKAAVAAGDFARASELQKARQAMVSAPTATPTQASERPVLGDLRPDVARKEGYGKEQGKDLAKERQNWAAADSASTTMENQLQTLKRLYATNVDVAQGEGASTLKAIKSNLKTLGVDVGETSSLEDIIQATASNMALHMRTAEGQNLMPGAMSNYEDKLLQGMAPGLSMTSEGRKAMIEFMLDITKSNKRIASEATKYEAANKQLDPGWYQRRERVMKEEQARLAQRRNELMSQFGSK